MYLFNSIFSGTLDFVRIVTLLSSEGLIHILASLLATMMMMTRPMTIMLKLLKNISQKANEIREARGILTAAISPISIKIVNKIRNLST